MPNRFIKNLEELQRLKGKTALIVGASGFLGSEIGLRLAKLGCTIRGIDNSSTKGNATLPYPCTYTYWDESRPIPAVVARGVDVIINVAGLQMLKGKWTPQRRIDLLYTKVKITERCVEAANQHEIPLMLQMSWTGYYGNTLQTRTNEWFPKGAEPTAEWAYRWEMATAGLIRSRTRLVILRASSVLSLTGGPLFTFLNNYMYGLGASLRHKSKYFSWIHIEDFLAIVVQFIDDPRMEGVYNVCTDQPCTLETAHRSLSVYYPNQMLLGASERTIKMTMGDKAPLYLQSSRVYPKRLIDTGFRFKFSSIADTLYDLLDYKLDSIIHFRYRYYLPAPRTEVYRAIADVTNWPKFYPTSVRTELSDYSSNPIREGTEIGYRIKYLGVNFGWREKVLNCDPGYTFQVMQLYGPLNFYEVTKTLTEVGEGTVYDVWHRCRLNFVPILKQFAYNNIQASHAQVRDHQGQVLASWFPHHEAQLKRAG